MLLYILLTAIVCLYYYLTWHFNYWRDRNIIGPVPWPFVGTFPKSAIYLRNFIYDQDQIYRDFRGKAPFVGVFTYRKPELLILSPKLVNEIFVGKFKHFQNNYTNYNKQNARLFSRNPFILHNDEWKENRADISGAFTTMKTKSTYSIVDERCKRLTKFINSKIESGHSVLDTKQITAKFTADVTSAVVYGLDANSIFDDSSEFLQIAHNVFVPSLRKLWFITFKSVFPYLFTYYEMPFITSDIERYFVGLAQLAVDFRNQQEEKPDDYLNFLMKLREKRSHELTDVAANTITFFLDAYETSSIILTHALYHMAKQPLCQAKLRQEIADCNGNIDFDVLSRLKYLDYVFNETLRISPPGFTITKVCSESIELENYDGKAVTIEEGTVVQVPIYSIHHDADLYPNPDQFDPDRFEDMDLKLLRDEGKFFPFGHGPRQCIGMRFSTLQIKAAIAEIVSHFELSVNTRTKEPIVIHPKDFLYLQIRDIYLNYKPIS